MKVTLVGATMRRCKSQLGSVGPPRIIKHMLRYIDLSETDDYKECSYLRFEDSETIERLHNYFLPQDEFDNHDSVC